MMCNNNSTLADSINYIQLLCTSEDANSSAFKIKEVKIMPKYILQIFLLHNWRRL